MGRQTVEFLLMKRARAIELFADPDLSLRMVTIRLGISYNTILKWHSEWRGAQK